MILAIISDDSVKHMESSIQFANTLLPTVKFPRNKSISVIICIKNHDTVPKRLGWKQEVPMECKVLRDADAIESLGCLGIIRYASWGGRHEMPFCNKSKKLDNKNNLFPHISLIENVKIRTEELLTRCHSRTGMRIMQKRLKIMQKFILEIKKEISFAENLGGE